MISVEYGANVSEAVEGFEGRNIGAARAAFAGPYNIPSDAPAVLNGQRAGESTLLTAGDELVFVKQTAQKG